MKWEHYVFHIMKDEIDVGFEQERMTELGNDRWELVSVVKNRYYFKRPIKSIGDDVCNKCVFIIPDIDPDDWHEKQVLLPINLRDWNLDRIE